MAAIQEETERGRARCGELLAALDYPKTSFEAVTADDWLGLRTATRLVDVVVWERSAAGGHGFFASAFQQILLDERRPAFIADRPPDVGGAIAVAWDGGREASRALRRSVPLLKKADRVVLLTVPHAMARPCDGARAVQYLDDHGIRASTDVVHTHGDASPAILDAARKMDTNILVAGAFGHPRLQRFIFGGTTQYLLESQFRPRIVPVALKERVVWTVRHLQTAASRALFGYTTRIRSIRSCVESTVQKVRQRLELISYYDIYI